MPVIFSPRKRGYSAEIDERRYRQVALALGKRRDEQQLGAAQYPVGAGASQMMIAKDESAIYVKTASEISPCTDKQWMQLFLRVGEPKASWEGYNFAVNRTVSSSGSSTLEKCDGGWKWSKVSDVKFSVKGSEMELSVPLASLGISDTGKFSVDFKWVDNAAADGDIQTCMRDGDSAPNGRFRYRYKFNGK